MSKLLPSITGVACFLWVSGWTWIFSEGKQSANAGSNSAPISILIDSMRYEVQHPFAFELSEATPIVVEALHPSIKSVANKLSKDIKNSLKITGIYSGSEKNETSYPNLGIARAEAIKSMLETSGGLGEQIETQGFEAANLFQMDGKLMGVVYFSFSSQKPENQKMVAEDDEKEYEEEASVLETAQSFYYKYGDYKVESRMVGLLNNLRRELRDNPNKKLVLTGYSAPEEEAESSRVNLAEMRALAIRRYLVDHGARRAQIETKAKPSMARSSKEMIVSVQYGH